MKKQKKRKSLPLDALSDLRELDQRYPGLPTVVLKKGTEGSEESLPPPSLITVASSGPAVSSSALGYTPVMG